MKNKYSKSKIIFEIDSKYRLMLQIICEQIVKKFPGIPLSWEDVYNQFLATVDEVYANYDETKNVKFKTYLGLKCRYFSLNYCRKFITKKHQVMNSYVEYNPNQNYIVSDSVEINKEFDISDFSEEELKIYSDFFINNKKIASISKEMKTSPYRVKKIISIVEQKIKKQL